jgi:DHA1 family multidrug resistance protein-like MFS transporter
MSVYRARARIRISAWLDHWRPLVPLFAAEFIVLVGFGALLPVLPLYIQDQGIDIASLGLIIAAWPLAKLLFEPAFGWWADRFGRKPLMVAGLLLLAVSNVLPLVLTSFWWLFVLRFVAGLATAMYDPAARGMVVDATRDDERGEAFGFYGAFQVAGLAVGPLIGTLGVALFGGFAFTFIFAGALSVVGALVVVRYVSPNPNPNPHPKPQPIETVPSSAVSREEPAEPPESAGAEVPTITSGDPFSASEVAVVPTEAPAGTPTAPVRAVFNKPVVAALVLTFGLHLSFGVYEVVWSIYLIALGATVAWVGFTFVLFSIPEVLVQPFAGRWVDRRGPIGLIVGSGLAILVAGGLYATATSFVVPSIVVPFEAAATAVMMPALYAMLAKGTPVGRASTAQGVFGAVSTLALVVSSLVAGWMFEQAIGLPFWFFVAGLAICLVAGVLIYRSALQDQLVGAEPGAA